PSSMAKSEARGLEEERRLFYVAITRARKTCTVTYARSRFKNGQTNSAKESRFLKEIDPAYVYMDANAAFNATTTEKAVDFWGTMREQRLQRESTTTKKNSYSGRSDSSSFRTGSSSGRLVSVQNTSPSLPLSKEAKELEEGDIIEHERFGQGEVTSIELSGNDRRAIVEFESAGRKQLLLKFAKFKIVGKK
ncbi:MAG: 3'-5' exonuclease, partial [Fermentimonas sp.]|nr:3'-5' exonuclease [Fermentimonas sp.]